jgi:hypothetical protein
MILCNALGELPAGFGEAVCWRDTWAEGCRLAIRSLNNEQSKAKASLQVPELHCGATQRQE